MIPIGGIVGSRKSTNQAVPNVRSGNHAGIAAGTGRFAVARWDKCWDKNARSLQNLNTQAAYKRVAGGQGGIRTHVAQGVCGVAKDLTKTASKSAIKLTAGDASGRLFRWVAFFTGSKNAMKGARFFLGGLLLETLGFRGALWAMAAALGLILLGIGLSLPPLMGRAKASRSAREFLGRSRGGEPAGGACVPVRRARRAVRRCPAGLPVRSGLDLRDARHLSGAVDHRLRHSAGAAPTLVRRSADGLASEVPAARWWSLALAVLTAALALTVAAGTSRPDIVVTIGLGLFGILFAVNSSVHPYLVLAYACLEKAAEDARVYYAANAAGRFGGTLLSGCYLA
jgi:hypothetical protein